MTRFWITALLLAGLRAAWAETLTIHASTEGPRTGTIDVLVFTSERGFPNKPDQAFRRVRVPVTAEGAVVCTVTNLPYGAYSLSLLHDVNDNRKADKAFGFGPPKEPVGFSNIRQKPQKKVRYKDTLIRFSAEQTEQFVRLWNIF
jgi:uncharacterized protein (DUF2141 family)